jgi:hypothetical protein
MLELMIALLGAAVFAPVSTAQMRSPRGAGFARSVGVSFSGRARSHSFGPGAIFLGDPFYADHFYADHSVAPVVDPPQFVVVQPAIPSETPPERKSEPLMIELQGNRYVRFGGRQQSAERGSSAPPDYREAEAGNSSPITPQLELPPTVLIFRDGHREEVPEYAIVGSNIYARGDDWQSGPWTKNIQLSALNISATVSANRDNGVAFRLPSAPNEVITRP